MAREMDEKDIYLYRTVVETEFLEDQTSLWGWRTHPAGSKKREVFGPYRRSCDSRNYSYVRLTRMVPNGKKSKWGSDLYDHVEIAKQTVKHQRLEPVFHLTPEKGLQLGLEWVTYEH